MDTKDIGIPHSDSVRVDREPPDNVLRVYAKISGKPRSHGFNAEKKHELIQAAGKSLGPRNAANKVIVYWSDGAETVMGC
jgi:hypothetical protein